MKLANSDEMRQLDKQAIEEYGIPGVVLMENAALGLVNILLGKHKNLLRGKVLIFCGKGNNGGDGFAIARHLANREIDVEVILLADPGRVRADAAINLEIIRKMGIPIQLITTREGLNALEDVTSGNELIIDAIFGTGLSSAVTGFYKEIIDFINKIPNFVLSVDIPSGLNSDTGKLEGVCVRANLTVTFGLPKRAHFITPSSDFVGGLEVVDISIPAKLIRETDCQAETIEKRHAAKLLPPRPIGSHKGNFGHLVVMGGSEGKGGAPAMAALAGLRSGAGLVTLAVPGKIQKAMEGGILEVMSFSLPVFGDEKTGEDPSEKIKSLLENKNAVVIGPGLGTGPQAHRLLRALIENITVPLVIDADGLNLLAGNKKLLENKKGPVVLTPHPGEMARLMGSTASEIQDRRLETAIELAGQTGCYVVLKGAGTIIVSPGGKAFINTTGNPGMATAGTGDVLAGIIGGFLAQGLGPGDASKLGVFLHGLAGDLAAGEFGEQALIAGDLISALPKAFLELA